MKADPVQIAAWMRRLHGHSAGLVHVCGSGDWTGRRAGVSEVDTVVTYAMARDAAGPQGTYLRATTLRPDAPSDRGQRAGAAWSWSLPGLWADIDLAGPGHKHTPNRPDLPGYNPRKSIEHPLPADEDAGRRLVDESGLLKPTLWVHSGGGLYPWWLLGDPADLSEPDLMQAAINLSEGWQRVLVATGERLDMAYGNVGDLARVLRIPGTVNRKAGLERRCEVVAEDGPVYSFADLVECWAAIQDDLDRQRAASQPAPVAVSGFNPITVLSAPAAVTPVAVGPRPGSPLDAFEQQASWASILEPHGWTTHHVSGATTYWTRPNKSRHEGHSATTGHSNDGHDRMWVFSTQAGLPTEQPMSKPYVWGLLNGHGSDMRSVAKTLVNQGFGVALTQQQPPPFTPPPLNGAPLPSMPPVPAPQPTVGPAPVQAPTAQSTTDTSWHPHPVRPGEGAPLPPFPVDQLPPVMRAMVEQVAGNKQVDPMMPALFALSTVSALTAGKMQILRSGDWVEALSFYSCVVAGTGERKSPTGRAMFGPVDQVEQRMAAAHGETVDQQVDELDQQRAEVRNNPGAANRLEDRIAAVEASRRRPPRIRLADDITPEAMVHLLGSYGGHGAVLDPEGTIMATLCGRYAKGTPNPELFIKAYDGDRYDAARISRDAETIRRPTLAVGIAAQQVVVTDAMSSKILLERGVLARFVWAFPPSLVGSRWERNALPHDPAPGYAWTQLINQIAELPNPESPDHIPMLCLSPQALALHIELSDSIEARMGPGGDLSQAGLKEWSHKHPGRVLRIAALLHLAAGFTFSVEVQEQTMRSAIVIGMWAMAHARHGHRLDQENTEQATHQQCQQVLDWLVRSKVSSCTRREAQRGVRAQWVNKDTIDDALDQLAELGWLRSEQYQDRSGRWRDRFAVSPHIARGSSAATM